MQAALQLDLLRVIVYKTAVEYKDKCDGWFANNIILINGTVSVDAAGIVNTCQPPQLIQYDDDAAALWTVTGLHAARRRSWHSSSSLMCAWSHR